MLRFADFEHGFLRTSVTTIRTSRLCSFESFGISSRFSQRLTSFCLSFQTSRVELLAQSTLERTSRNSSSAYRRSKPKIEGSRHASNVRRIALDTALNSTRKSRSMPHRNQSSISPTPIGSRPCRGIALFLLVREHNSEKSRLVNVPSHSLPGSMNITRLANEFHFERETSKLLSSSISLAALSSRTPLQGKTLRTAPAD